MKAVQAIDLVKTYNKGKVRALDGLSLDVEQGTVLGILGPNGAGKTTTVRILATLLRPDSGSAFVAGLDRLDGIDHVLAIGDFAEDRIAPATAGGRFEVQEIVV